MMSDQQPNKPGEKTNTRIFKSLDGINFNRRYLHGVSVVSDLGIDGLSMKVIKNENVLKLKLAWGGHRYGAWRYEGYYPITESTFFIVLHISYSALGITVYEYAGRISWDQLAAIDPESVQVNTSYQLDFIELYDTPEKLEMLIESKAYEVLAGVLL